MPRITLHSAVGCHYFPPGLQTPSQPKNVTFLRSVPRYTFWWQVWTTCPCLLRSFVPARSKPTTYWSQVQCLTATPLCHLCRYVSCALCQVSAYCYNGECRTHQSQCRLLWGDDYDDGDSACYSVLNGMGRRGASCGFDITSGTYLPCSSEYVYCWLVHLYALRSCMLEVKVMVKVTSICIACLRKRL